MLRWSARRNGKTLNAARHNTLTLFHAVFTEGEEEGLWRIADQDLAVLLLLGRSGARASLQSQARQPALRGALSRLRMTPVTSTLTRWPTGGNGRREAELQTFHVSSLQLLQIRTAAIAVPAA